MRRRPWIRVKPKIPLIGFDDGRFIPRERRSYVPIVGVVMKGAAYLEGVLQDFMLVDAESSQGITPVILRMLRDSPHLGQLRGILTPGITFGGFSVLDLKKIYEELSIPVIAVMRRFPDFVRIKKALLENFHDGKQRWDLIKKAGEPMVVPSSDVFVQFVGCTFNISCQIIQQTAINGKLPEPLRVARLIASGLSYGQV